MPQASKSLPARPNLEHLRKQAKRRLRLLRVANREAKLADAHLEIAREYGFASWRKLSAAVELERSTPGAIDFRSLARKAVGAMERAWTESYALIEREADRAGPTPRWEAGKLHSPTLLERECDTWITRKKQLGLYRMTSIWHAATITATGRAILDFKPMRVLEFFRGGDAHAKPVGGAWRRIDWEPSRAGLTGKPGRFDDLAEALKYLTEPTTPPGEYRVITIRRMLRAEQAKDRIKIIKKHAGMRNFPPLGVPGDQPPARVRNRDWKPLMDAAFQGDDGRIRVLLAAGADPDVVSATGHRYRPLHRAIEFKKTHRRGPEHEAVVALLLAGGADPKLRGGWSRLTALQLAATGEWRFVPILREHFEPLDIFHAAAVAAVDRVAALLNKSPELASAKDENGWTALHYCCASAAYQQGPREIAALVHIAQMLIEGGADVSATWVFDPQWPIPPLYHCCGQHDNPAVAEVLFQAGAQPCDNETVYHASDEDHRGALALIERYAKPKPLAEECTKCLLTQLHWGRVRGAPWLLAHGADPTRKNKAGKTAFDLAAGKPRLLKLLRTSS